MKWFLTTLALAAALSAGAMPASADVYDNWLSGLGRQESQSGQLAQRRGYYSEQRSAQSERRRIARADFSDDADGAYRPRRSARGGDRAHNSRHNPQITPAAAVAASCQRTPCSARPCTAVGTTQRQHGWLDRLRAIGRGLLLLAGTTGSIGRLVQPQCHDGRAQKPAIRHPRARHPFRQRPFGGRRHQR